MATGEDFNELRAYLFLAALIVCQLTFLVAVIEWLYPPNETPNNAKVYKMTRNFQSLARTGAPVLPATALSLGELRRISLENAFKKRKMTLNEEDAKLLGAVKDIEVNYVKDRKKLHVDTNLAYGPIFTRRMCFDVCEERKPLDDDATPSSLKMQVKTINTAEEEDMIRKPLKRQKKEDKKKKKKKTINALNMLTQDPVQNENAKSIVKAVQSPMPNQQIPTPPKVSNPPTPGQVPSSTRGPVNEGTPVQVIPKFSRNKLTEQDSLDLDGPVDAKKKRTNRLKQKKSCEAIDENVKSAKSVKVVELKKKRTPKGMLASTEGAMTALAELEKSSNRKLANQPTKRSRRNRAQKSDELEKSKEGKGTPTKRTPLTADDELGAKTKTEDAGKNASSTMQTFNEVAEKGI